MLVFLLLTQNCQLKDIKSCTNAREKKIEIPSSFMVHTLLSKATVCYIFRSIHNVLNLKKKTNNRIIKTQT